MLYLLLACSDYKLASQDTAPVPFEDADTDTGRLPEDTGDVVPPEECNGVDDDGDGIVDEDYGDVDGDGTADCVDDTCDVGVRAAGTVPLSEACGGTTTVDDPWSTTATNVWTGLSTNPRVASIAQTPLVVQLTDDNGDGVVDDRDTADVAFVAFDNAGSDADVVVLDSATWAEELDIPDVYFGAELAVGDVDGDGVPDLLTYDKQNRLHAWRADGAELWRTDALTTYIGGEPSVAVVDLEGDGVAEVLAQETIFDGATGTKLASLPARPFSYTQHVAADLDLDGIAEILYDGDVHTADGVLAWSGLAPGAAGMTHAMALNVDADPEGEVVMASDNQLDLYDTDGTLLSHTVFPGGYASVPCAGDFDGDGAPEIAVPGQSFLHVFELDGTETAAMSIVDSSTMAGCVGADLDGDGAVEIIYADEDAFHIFDARTGTALVTYSEHASGTLTETPALADLDQDGSVEILLGSNDNMGRDVWMGLTVIRHAGAGWTPGPTGWPANARVEGRFDSSGDVVDVGTWWTREDTFRTVASAGVPLVRDARLRVDDVCVASCEADGVVQVTVGVDNPGRDTIPAETEVVLSRVDGGVRSEVGRQPLGADLPSGASSPSLTFALTTADVGLDGFVATLDGAPEDCHPEDDEASWYDVPVCP